MTSEVQSGTQQCSNWTGHCWHPNGEQGGMAAFVCCWCNNAGWQTHGPYRPRPTLVAVSASTTPVSAAKES